MLNIHGKIETRGRKPKDQENYDKYFSQAYFFDDEEITRLYTLESNWGRASGKNQSTEAKVLRKVANLRGIQLFNEDEENMEMCID